MSHTASHPLSGFPPGPLPVRPLLAAALLAAVSLSGPASVAAQSDVAAQSSGETREDRRWWNVWSHPSGEDRLVAGMWTTHLNREKDGWQNDRAVVLILDGFYGGTFRTTHGPRAYSLGVERSWLSGSRGALGGMLGFRTGLVYGYDGRLGWVAEKYPILPFAQPVLYARLGPLAADLTYTWVVISLTAALRF